MKLRANVSHQIDHHSGIAPRQDQTLKAGGFLPDLKLSADRRGHVGNDIATTFECQRFCGKEV